MERGEVERGEVERGGVERGGRQGGESLNFFYSAEGEDQKVI